MTKSGRDGTAGEMTPDCRGHCPEQERDQRQHGRQRTDLGLDRLKGCPRGQHTGRAIASLRPALTLVSSRRPGPMVPAAAIRRPAMASPAADRPRQHPPAQAVGPLDRRRQVHRKRAEVAAVEHHRPSLARRPFNPPARLVVDGPGHAAARALGAIRKSVQRRLQLLVQGEPQPQPGYIIKARGEPAQGQRQRHEKGDRDPRDQRHGASSTARASASPSK